jgi:AraC-like DNA-binding protein
MLASGKAVTEAAFDLGYSSVSAFTFAFRKELGVSPLAYIRKSKKQAAGAPQSN